MDEEKILLIRLLIGDFSSSPLYPLFTDEELYQFLEMSNGNVMRAARYAAISASMILSGYNTWETTGDISVRNSIASNYLAALRYFISDGNKIIPEGLMPWSAGINRLEVCAMAKDPNIDKSKLMNIFLCDNDNDCCGPSFPNTGGCC